MKKYLIALPLVLIMILSMVPVMAANKTVNVPVTYYKTPDQKDILKTETRAIEVDEADLADAKKLEAAVEAAIKGFGFPKLDTAVQPEWTVKATAKAQTQGETTYTVEKKILPEYPLAKDALDHARAQGLTINDKGLTGTQNEKIAKGEVFAKVELLRKINEKIGKIADGTATATDKIVTLVADDLSETQPTAPENPLQWSAVPVAGAVTEASVSAVAYPNCFVEPTKPVEKWCPELCDYIVVVVYDVFAQDEVVSMRHTYNVDPKKVPTYEGIYNHFMRNYFNYNDYQVLKDWRGQNDIYFPEGLDRDCVIEIYVLPTLVKVDVVHEMWDCCETLDGVKKFTLWRKFYEESVYVDFIAYHSDLVFNHEKAKVFADTRLQKINANDFVFINAFFDDGVRLDGYMTGKVYDFFGNETTIKDVNPRITLRYERAGCQKEEEKVDNATVENNANTQAPVTASGTQLPATGAKDVTAFFLSAVALLGLGIFFAKKH